MSCCGNFSHPIYRVSKASVPSVRCSRRSSSVSGFFSSFLFLRKPSRPRYTCAVCTTRIKSSLFWRLNIGMRRCFPAKARFLNSRIGTEGGNRRGRSVHTHKMSMNVAVTAESRIYRESGGELTTRAVYQHGHFCVGVATQGSSDIVGVEVTAPYIAFQMKMILCHWADVFVFCRKGTILYIRAKRQK